MFGMGFFLLLTAFFAFIQIEFWLMFPKKLRDILIANPILAFILTFIAGLSISMFTGIASFVGMCNVCADVVFALWAFLYKKHNGITGLGMDWHRAFGKIPLFPKVMVCYCKDGKTWMA